MEREEIILMIEKAINCGYGRSTTVNINGHWEDPSACAKHDDRNVIVRNFGRGEDNYDLDLDFKTPIQAAMLFPISALFEKYQLLNYRPYQSEKKSGREEMLFSLARDLKLLIKGLSIFECGIFEISYLIRFLNEISLLESNEIINYCYENGNKCYIHGNHVELKKLLLLCKLEHKMGYCEADFILPNDSIFEKISIHSFDGYFSSGSNVFVTLKKGRFLPPIPFPDTAIYAHPRDTALGAYIPENLQPTDFRDTYGEYIVARIPIMALKAQRSRVLVTPPPHHIHKLLNNDFGEILFNLPNLLDAAMTAVFMIKVVDPIAKDYFK